MSQFRLKASLAVLVAGMAAATARSATLDNSLTVSTGTLSGNAFSVGSAFVVSGGQVAIGTTTLSGALNVAGLVGADNVNGAATFSTKPASRYAPTAANTWLYTGESIQNFVVPAGPSRRYRVVMRQMISNGNAGYTQFAVGTSNSSLTGTLFDPWQYLPAGVWATTMAETILTLAPGTYNYYVWVDVSATLSSPSIANATSDADNFCSFYIEPL